MNDVDHDLSSPPHDEQAEQAVLGSILKNPRAIHEVVDLLAPEAFYDARNRHVFTAMLSLVRQDVAIDYHTLAAELQRLGLYESAGGLLYLSQIGLATPSAAHIEHYGRIVADHSVRRRAISVAQTIAEQAWRARDPVDEFLARSQSAVLGLSDSAGVRTRSSTAVGAIDRWLETFDRQSETNDRGDRIVGHSTSLRCLDRITLGLQPARLYLLSAYTSVGKSQLAHQVALHVARHHGTVLMASLEMSDLELTTRAIAQESGIPVEALATHDVDEREAAAVLAVAQRQSTDPLHYMDGADGLTTSQIRSRALQLQGQHGRLALIVVDYGQLLQDSKGNNSTVEDQTLVSRNLKRLARALDVPLLVPVQINRQSGARSDQRPKLSDIRESGCVTADTRLLRADTGEPVEIGHLLRNGWGGVRVWSLDDRGRMQAAPVTRVFASGTKPVFRLRLSSGRSVKASANHRFFTVDGWVELGSLRHGALLAIPRRIPEPIGTDYCESALYKTPSRASMTCMDQVLGQQRLATLVESDIFWDAVASIEPLGEQPVFDASVDGTHNFIADGIVAHNSWEQDADVVVGLYRDELVHPDTDERGLLELIVLKNRHAGEKPPSIFKAVWARGRYWEWDRNSYAERASGRQNGTTSSTGVRPQSSRLP